ncbi:MAG: histidinol-phosphate transaminase [Saprospiraceae bacterium]
MTNITRRKWLKTITLASGAMAVLPNALYSLDHIRPYDDDISTWSLGANPIRLSSNENPYGPSALVREKMVAAFNRACRYPGSEVASLTAKIADKEGVSPEHILLTVGSTEGLKITALAYFQDGGELVTAHPTFEAMPNYAEACGVYVHRVPVNKNLGLDLPEMEKRCNANTKMVFVCNPNNPTGTILPANEMMHFCEKMAKVTMVFSDEAYCDYITIPNYPSMVSLVKQNLNVIVAKTFSKVYGLAGVRIGYLIARPDIIARIDRFQVDNPNMLGLAAAEAAMDEKAFYDDSVQKNKESKSIITNTLDQLGLTYTDSHGNFIFFKSGMDITKFREKMLAEKIMVGRPFPPFNDWCRVSTGTLEEMQLLKAGLMKVLTS